MRLSSGRMSGTPADCGYNREASAMASVQTLTKDERLKALGTVHVVNVLDPQDYA